MINKEEITPRLREYVQKITRPSKGKDMFVCPLCKSGAKGGRDSDGAFHVSGSTWYCHSCQEGGDIFTLHGKLHNLDVTRDFPQIVDEICQELGITALDSARRDFASVGQEAPQKKANPERAKLIEVYFHQISGSSAEKYLHERGFSDEIIKKFRLGYNPKRKVWNNNLKRYEEYEALVIPYPGEDFFTERLLNPGEDVAKYQNQTGTAPTFIIRESDSDLFFVTEGQLDALSLIQAGAKNVIASHYTNRLDSYLDGIDYNLKRAVIVADHDPEEKRDEKTGLTPGEKTARELTELFTRRNIESMVVYAPEEYKDANDILKDDQEKLSTLISGWIKDFQADVKITPSFREVNVSEYLTGSKFSEDIEYFKKYKNRKTGFENIDKYLTLYPGLACLTGSTSLGKTSFCVQLADQLVEKGETILYFTLEQLPIELVTKSLARMVYQRNVFSQIDNIDIKNGATSEDLESVKKIYIQKSKRFNIIECDFTVSADKIVEYVDEYVQKTKLKPIVIIDYLQIISAPEGERFDDRERIDDAVKKFKLMTKRHEIFALMISNMARSSYKERVGEESFKESGLIEYTCDYLFGLQLSILEDDKFFSKKGTRGGEKDTGKYEKEALVFDASQAMPKEVVFKSMKNRNGQKVFRAFFKYYPNFDFFETDFNSKYDKKSASNHFDGLPETDGEDLFEDP